MIFFKNIQTIYFLGVGGIGMSGLARYFRVNGKQVSGYDKTVTALTRQLETEGIHVQYDFDLSEANSLSLEHTLVVYTPAIAHNNPLFQFFKTKGFLLKKRAEVLGLITKGVPTLAVAGTHGKTTTSTILAHILKVNGTKLTAFLGGISENYQSNVLLDGNDAVVVEADEFDRSFLQLHPTMAAVTSMDADHLDIYGENEQLQQSFRDFVNLLPAYGQLFYKKNLPLANGFSLAVEDSADFSAQNVRVDNGVYFFDFETPDGTFADFRFSLPGKHNLLNAVTALSMAYSFGVKVDKLREALESFKGVHRRFSYRLKTPSRVLIDDYAHHPTEIRAVHQAVREMFPGEKVLAVFQPHLYSRTRDFADDFASSLDLFDAVRLLDIYPAREEPIPGINASFLLAKMKHAAAKKIEKENLIQEVQQNDCPIVVLMGAGDIGEEVEPLRKILAYEK